MIRRNMQTQSNPSRRDAQGADALDMNYMRSDFLARARFAPERRAGLKQSWTFGKAWFPVLWRARGCGLAYRRTTHDTTLPGLRSVLQAHNKRPLMLDPPPYKHRPCSHPYISIYVVIDPLLASVYITRLAFLTSIRGPFPFPFLSSVSVLFTTSRPTTLPHPTYPTETLSLVVIVDTTSCLVLSTARQYRLANPTGKAFFRRPCST